MKKITAFYLILCVSTVLFAAADNSGKPYREGRVIVQFDESVVPTNGAVELPPGLDQLAKGHKIQSVRPAFFHDRGKNMGLKQVHGLDRYYALDFPPGADVEAISAEIILQPGVLSADPDWIGEASNVYPNDTHFGIQWPLDNTGQSFGTPDADMDCVEGWDFTTGASSVIVAVLDSGIDSAHPEFDGRILPGWDFVNEDSNPEDDQSHGTRVSGIIAANADNNFGLAGINWNCKILPVKVLNENNRGYTSDLIDGLIFAADQGADVVNMSLQNYPCNNGSLRSALQYARDAGVILVSAAGNYGIGHADISGPGCYEEVISVGATDRNDQRTSWSATGEALDVMAPGTGVPATPYHQYNDTWGYFGGTSAACPNVVGLCSLMRSLRPDIGHDEVKFLLEANAKDQIGDPTQDQLGRDNFYGWGRVNIFDTLADVQPEALHSGYVKPGQVDTGGSASFGVVYASASNTAPDYVNLALSGPQSGTFAMSLSTSGPAVFHDGDYTNGELYEALLSFPLDGEHSFHFEASEASVALRFPETGEISGPTVGIILRPVNCNTFFELFSTISGSSITHKGTRQSLLAKAQTASMLWYRGGIIIIFNDEEAGGSSSKSGTPGVLCALIHELESENQHISEQDAYAIRTCIETLASQGLHINLDCNLQQ